MRYMALTMSIVLWFLSCFAVSSTGGCVTSHETARAASGIYRQRPTSPLVPPIERPPEDFIFDKKLYLVIETVPSGADVYTFETDPARGAKRGPKIGTTTLEIPIWFGQYDGQWWFKNSELLWGGVIWSPYEINFQRLKQGYEALADILQYGEPYPTWKEYLRSMHWITRVKRPMLLFVDHPDYYGLTVASCFEVFYKVGVAESTEIRCTRDSGPITDGSRILPPAGFPVRLVKHGRVFSREIAEAISKDDYYGAEELRLSRIEELENLLREVRDRKYPVEVTIDPSSVHVKLMDSELDRLKHLVGLLDTQLMGLRKQLLAKLKEGDVDASVELAKTVEALEKRYFPPEPPKTIVMQSPRPAPSEQRPIASVGDTQAVQGPTKQEIVIQQKPYYGVSNIVQALGAIRGSKITPEAYQRAFGTAQLLDIMGFGAGLLNK